MSGVACADAAELGAGAVDGEAAADAAVDVTAFGAAEVLAEAPALGDAPVPDDGAPLCEAATEAAVEADGLVLATGVVVLHPANPIASVTPASNDRYRANV